MESAVKQVVWVVEPALFCAPAAVALARLCGAKAWLHVQDFEVDAAFSMGLLRGARIRRLVTPAPTWLRWCKPAAWWCPPKTRPPWRKPFKRQ